MTETEFRNSLPVALTEEQWAAVNATDGPVLVLAVPGSGKTTALVCRIGFMILVRGIEPERILALSYTVASARDMGDRFRSFFGDAIADRVRFRTINSLCVAVMQEYERRSGKKSFRLAEDRELAGILTGIYRRYGEGFPTENDISEMKRIIAYIKNMCLGTEEIAELEYEFSVSDLYRDYEAAMRSSGLMDYDDQLKSAYVLLNRIPDILEVFRERYPYILVDEAQDSSKIQHMIFRILASGAGNLCEVGDEDQSIYGFRAAYPKALLDFEKDFPGARVLIMSVNFRSVPEVTERADRFIAKNKDRHEKHMRASRKEGGQVRQIELTSRSAQYTYLLKVAKDCRVRTGVLYRNNESALPLIDLLERQGAEYSLRSAEMNFFTHRVVQDVENILRFSLNPADPELFLQVYYKIRTYLTKELARRMAEKADGRRAVLSEIYRTEGVSARTAASVKKTAVLLGEIAKSVPSEAMRLLAGELGYLEYLERSSLDPSKLYLLFQLSYRESTVPSFLNRLQELRGIVADKKNSPGCPFLLSTVHGAKGLEYDRVYLLDMLDGILPEKPLKRGETLEPEEEAAYEEARRLYYVAVTRAKDELNIFTFESDTSQFSKELLKEPGKKKTVTSGKGPGANRQPKEERNLSDGGYERFLESLYIGRECVHAELGSCVIEGLDRNIIVLRAGTEVKKYSLQFLYLHGQLC